MAQRKVSRNAPCPCGSGKKYKQCCLRKDFDWLEDDDGNIFKSIPITGEMTDLLEEQRQSFIVKHGRKPGPDDLVFPEMPHLEHAEHQMIQIMKEAGIDPAIIYATEKTGRLVTEENQRLLSGIEIDEWTTAIEEYRAEQGSLEPPEFPIGTVALYGPDDKTTTKIAAGVILEDDAEAIIERWVGTGVKSDPKVQRSIEEFFAKHGVKSVVATEENMGCPHEEGEDFPVGEDCPFCPYWKGKQGSNSPF
ncbi:MAG: SEC-C metal-binding domain-containing protein [Pirellulaceae bacterium]